MIFLLPDTARWWVWVIYTGRCPYVLHELYEIGTWTLTPLIAIMFARPNSLTSFNPIDT